MVEGRRETINYSIGRLSSEVNRKLSERICALLHGRLGIPPDQIYLNFISVTAVNWGWNGSIFD